MHEEPFRIDWTSKCPSCVKLSDACSLSWLRLNKIEVDETTSHSLLPGFLLSKKQNFFFFVKKERKTNALPFYSDHDRAPYLRAQVRQQDHWAKKFFRDRRGRSVELPYPQVFGHLFFCMGDLWAQYHYIENLFLNICISWMKLTSVPRLIDTNTSFFGVVKTKMARHRYI